MRRSLQALLALVLLAGLAAVAAGCGDDEEPAGDEPAAEREAGDGGDSGDEGGGGDEPQDLEVQPGPAVFPTAAGIDPATGAFRGLQPDDREGSTPPNVAAGGLQQAARAAGCTLRLNLRDEGNEHLDEGQGPPKYGTKPATSGNHDPVPVADGAYRETPPVQNVVHSLEHGRVAIQYAPTLPEDQQLILKGVFDADPDGVLLFPNAAMPYDVAVGAWRNLIGCESAGDAEAVAAAVLAFRDRFRGKGPERIPL